MATPILLTLILCNIIWASNPTVTKGLLLTLNPEHAAVVRYSSALFSYVVLVSFFSRFKFFKKNFGKPFLIPKTRFEFLTLFIGGFFTFCFSPLFQTFGLAKATATENALIIAMEPLVTVFMAWIFLREKLASAQVVSFLVAIYGFSLLSGLNLGDMSVSSSEGQRLIANALMLLSLFGEGCFSIVARNLSKKHRPLEIFGSTLFFGTVLLILVSLIHAGPVPLHLITGDVILRGVWLGALGTAITYFYWMWALGKMSVATITLTLFVQPVAGSILGYLILNEHLTFRQGIGGGLILIAVFSSQVKNGLRLLKQRFYTKLVGG